MNNQRNIILLVSAATGNLLTELDEEIRDIQNSFDDAGVGGVRICPAARVEDVIGVLQRGGVSIFHFAGHADGEGLLLRGDGTDGEKAFAEGLGSLLRDQEGIQLVFLNGCATVPQVMSLLEKGIPMVIATSQGVDDSVARKFANAFYKALTKDRTIREAFQMAQGAVEVGLGQNVRGAYSDLFLEAESNPVHWPWKLYGSERETNQSLRDLFQRDEKSGYKICVSSDHELSKYPIFPAVFLHSIPASIPKAYGDLFPDDASRKRLVVEANQLRLEADPDCPPSGYISAGSLPAQMANGEDFWWDAFQRAGKASPRMLAALLLVVEPNKFEKKVQQARSQFLQDLESWGE